MLFIKLSLGGKQVEENGRRYEEKNHEERTEWTGVKGK